MHDRIDLLIEILTDKKGREDEREDAAMAMRKFPVDRTLQALALIASDPTESSSILDSCGESIAEIIVNRNEINLDLLRKLALPAQRAAYAYIKNKKPDWLNDEPPI